MQRRPRRDSTNAISRKNIASNIIYVNFPNISAQQTLVRTAKVHVQIRLYILHYSEQRRLKRDCTCAQSRKQVIETDR